MCPATDTAAPVDDKAKQDAEAAVTEAHEKVSEAYKQLEDAQKAKRANTPRMQGFRAFVAPVEQNTRFLVKPGQVSQIRDPNSPTGQRDAMRVGDKFAQFTGGTLVTDDPDIIAWCEAHEEICRDAELSSTVIWYNLKLGQTPLATQDPSLPSSIDIDGLMRGEYQRFDKGGKEVDVVGSARDFARIQNEQAGTP